MQPDSPLPPSSDSSTKHDLLEEMAALTGLFNPEIIWKEELILDALDDQEQANQAAESATPIAPTNDQP